MKVVSLRDTRSTCAGKEKIQKERGSRRYGVIFLSYFLLINTAIIAVWGETGWCLRWHCETGDQTRPTPGHRRFQWILLEHQAGCPHFRRLPLYSWRPGFRNVSLAGLFLRAPNMKVPYILHRIWSCWDLRCQLKPRHGLCLTAVIGCSDRTVSMAKWWAVQVSNASAVSFPSLFFGVIGRDLNAQNG